MISKNLCLLLCLMGLAQMITAGRHDDHDHDDDHDDGHDDGHDSHRHETSAVFHPYWPFYGHPSFVGHVGAPSAGN